MLKRIYVQIFIFLLLLSPWLFSQTVPQYEELKKAENLFTRWFGDKSISDEDIFPGGLLIDSVPITKDVATWQREISTTRDQDKKLERLVTFRHKTSGLVIQYKAVLYHDYPVIEWTVFYKNEGKENTPILHDLKSIDTIFPEFSGQKVVLHRNKGDNCTADSYQPISESLDNGQEIIVSNTGGRPTQTAFPYFNFEGEKEGLIYVISWAGQWACKFSRDNAGRLAIHGGQEITRFFLYPDEEVRGPMVVLMPYIGNKQRGQNLWRQWMIHCNLPKQHGKPVKVPMLLSCSATSVEETYKEDTESHKMLIQKYIDRGFHLDYWWIDAGWYPCDRNWPKTGTWVVDETRFPGGLKPISDFAHSKNIKLLLWFEPERVHAGTWLAENHPEWIIGGKDGGLLNLGNKEARQWLIDYIGDFIKENGIDLYRQDFNIDPLDYWCKNDKQDRQGITEIRHVEGYFEFWDELRRRYPDMLIDSCASGGRRNDLETLRRAVPLLRSDYIVEPIGNQCHTWALSEWIPFNGTGTDKTSIYEVMSVFTSSFTACWNQRDDSIDWKRLKELIDDRYIYGECYYGDYYPLTPYSIAKNDWIGWQFNLQSKGIGFIQAFRRPEAENSTKQVYLFGLDANKKYKLISLIDDKKLTEMSGGELMTQGIELEISEKPGVILVFYKRIE